MAPRILIFAILFLSGFKIPGAFALFEDKEKEALKSEAAALKNKNSQLSTQLENVTSDRDNILKQAKNFLKDKEEIAKKMEEMKSQTKESSVELDSLMKENEILKSQIEKLKTTRAHDEELHHQEKEALQKKVADFEARMNSLAKIREEYPPEKIQQLVEDRNRLQAENKTG